MVVEGGEKDGILFFDELQPTILDHGPYFFQSSLNKPTLFSFTRREVIARIGDDALDGGKGQVAILELAEIGNNVDAIESVTRRAMRR